MDVINDMRKFSTITEHQIDNAEDTEFPHNFSQYDDTWDFNIFVEKFKINIIRMEEIEMEFDMIGVSAAIANAFRRILLAEVPTMAIEKVLVYNNTTLFQDEFLSHRLGLIPIKADPRFFDYRKEGDTEGTPDDTIVLSLSVKCTKNKSVSTDKSDSLPEESHVNRMIYTKHIDWIPIGNQSEKFPNNPIKPVDDDILIAKLSAGQELDLKMHCVKGIGKDHAKFSPVATASYRLLPEITLLRQFEDEDADKLQQCFSFGVIEVVPQSNGTRIARVCDSRLDKGSRNIFRYPQFKDGVKMCLVKQHFIYNIESTGALPANQLFCEAIDILIEKCRHFLVELEDYKKQ